jgi:hypothetical protein
MDKCWSLFGSRNWNLDKPGAGTYHDWSEIAHRWAWKPTTYVNPRPGHTHIRRFFRKTFFLIASPVQLPWNGFFGLITLTTWQGACIGRKLKKHRNKQQLRVEFSFQPPVEGNSMLWVKLGDWWCSDHRFPSIPQAEAHWKNSPLTPSLPPPPLPRPGCVNQHPHWYHGKNPQNPFKMIRSKYYKYTMLRLNQGPSLSSNLTFLGLKRWPLRSLSLDTVGYLFCF